MLYIMRHGKTDWNVRRKLQGRTDIPLNDEGRRMACEAGEKYKDVHFDVCYSSPLTRARETAELFLQGRNVPILTDDRLKEMCFGVYEGVENSFQIPDCPVNLLFRDPVHYVAVEGGESFRELFARTGAFLREVIDPQLREGRDVLIMGHGAMNCSIICQVKGLDLAHFWDCGMENCHLFELGEWTQRERTKDEI